MQEIYRNGKKGPIIEGNSLEELIPKIKKSLKKPDVAYVKLFIPSKKRKWKKNEKQT